MRAQISSEVLAAIASDGAAADDREICGLLLGEGARVTARLACANVAADPARRFEIDPAALLAAHRAARSGGPAIIGCYHSHPAGSSHPSARDAADAQPNGWLWLIVSAGEAACWRAVDKGTLFDRFDPVSIDVMVPQALR